MLGAGVIALAAWLGLVLGVQTLPVALPLAHYLLAAGVAWLLFATLGSGAFQIASCFSRTALSNALGGGLDDPGLCAGRDPVFRQLAARLDQSLRTTSTEIVATGQVDPFGLIVLFAWLVGGARRPLRSLTAAIWRRR